MTTMTKRLSDGTACPNEDRHTPSPVRYLAWHEWAEGRSKTHRQVRCPGCGHLAVWVPKTRPVPDGTNTEQDTTTT